MVVITKHCKGSHSHQKEKEINFVEKVEANLEENYSFVAELKKIKTFKAYVNWFTENLFRVVQYYSGLWIVACLFQLFVAITQTTFGLLNLNECPVEPMVPVYLAFQGVANLAVWFFEYVVPTFGQVLENKGVVKHAPFKSSDWFLIKFTKYVWFAFTSVWLIAGSYWMFDTTIEFYDQDLPRYCDEFIYNNALTWLITCYVVAALALYACVIGLCLIFVNCVLLKKSKRAEDKVELNEAESCVELNT